MKKMLASLFLAASAFFIQPVDASDPRWGYVFLTETVEQDSGYAVDWDGPINGVQQIHSEGICVNPDDSCTILIKHPGTYLVTYSVTVEVLCSHSDDGDAQFALYLNDCPVYGSVYATGNAFSSGFISDVFNGALNNDPLLTYDAESQISGQAIVVVNDYNSLLSLKNHCENDLTLSAQAGHDDPNFGNNVSASILIHRIDKHYNCED